MTFPAQPAPVPGAPVQPRKTEKNLLIGIGIGLVVGILLGCCGGVVIGRISDQPGKGPTATAPMTSVPSPGNAPTTPAGTPSATATVVVMPDLIGQNAAVATDELRKLGFTKIQYGTQDKNDRVVLLPSNWTVIKQSTEAGSTVTTDTLIVLTCTKEN